MKALMEIQLQKVKVFGFHGLHEGENVIGGEFEVNLSTIYKPDNIIIKNIEETLDYTELLKIVKKRMQQPAHLLETIATEIAGEIISKFSIVTEVAISIYKLHPPIEEFEGSVGITYKLKR